MGYESVSLDTGDQRPGSIAGGLRESRAAQGKTLAGILRLGALGLGVAGLYLIYSALDGMSGGTLSLTTAVVRTILGVLALSRVWPLSGLANKIDPPDNPGD